MTRLLRSGLFKRQLLDMTADYRDRAGSDIALRLVDQIEDSVAFIARRPQACAVYTQVQGKTFRKWGVKDFPVSLFFRVEPDGTIILDALYAHRMNIAARLPDEIDQAEFGED